jgi:hypothetical protein
MVAKLAPEHLRERYLPGLLTGELFCSAAISEPDVGSNWLRPLHCHPVCQGSPCSSVVRCLLPPTAVAPWLC